MIFLQEKKLIVIVKSVFESGVMKVCVLIYLSFF